MDDSDRPYCFGDLETVFPLGEDGLRHSPESCMYGCSQNTECLRTALKGDKGDQVQEERIDRAVQSGKMGFLERWAQKKALYHRRQQRQTRREP